MTRTLICMLAGLLPAILTLSSPARADVVIITQAKAEAGNVTSDDDPGFPVKLTQPGSYRLASNLTPGVDKDGIVAAAPDITIDLDGFRISGGSAGGSNNSLKGIVGQGDRLTVKNGTIGGFEVAGISAPSRLFLIVENMRIVNNVRGIDNHSGVFARIQNSTVSLNAIRGIDCGESCHVEGSVISNNGGHGIIIVTGTVLGNTLIKNKLLAIQGSNANSVGVGYGNNTLLNNNSGGEQQNGKIFTLFPNACRPTPCPES